MEKLFKEADLKKLISQVSNEEISFSRMVEIINEKASERELKNNSELIKRIETLNECWLNEIKLRGGNLIEIKKLKSMLK